jgi:uncharacterized protein YjeT (DUF2065 family)
MSKWSLFFTALGLAFVLEGLPYFVWAERMPKYLRELAAQKPSLLRLFGLCAITLGMLLVFLARSN